MKTTFFDYAKLTNNKIQNAKIKHVHTNSWEKWITKRYDINNKVHILKKQTISTLYYNGIA